MAAAKKDNVFDIDTQQVGAVYAKAFIGAATSAGKLDELVAELESLIVDLLDKQPEFEKLLSSSFLSHEEKLGVLDRTLGSQSSVELLSSLKVISSHGRLDCLRAIQRAVAETHNLMQGRRSVTITTAKKINEQLKSELLARLKQEMKYEPQLSTQIDPSLLGGLVVQVGDTIVDGSVATRLKKLRGEIIDRVVEAIETGGERFE